MRGGELRQRVSILAATETSDGHDGKVKAYGTTVRRRIAANVQPLQGRDLERARQIDPRLSHLITLRYWRDYVDELKGGRNRIVYHDLADRTFEIVGPPVDTEEAHVQIVQTCKEAA